MLRLPIIKPKTKSWIRVINIILALLFIITNGFIILLTRPFHTNNYAPILIITGAIFFLLFVFNLFNTKELNEIGAITFDYEKITITLLGQENEFSIFSLKNTSVKINGYHGQQLTGGEPPKEGFADMTTADGYNQVQGYQNIFTYTNPASKTESYNFYIENKAESDQLKAILSNWKTKFNIKLKILR